MTFDKTPPVFEKTEGAAVFNGKATVMAMFSQPGENTPTSPRHQPDLPHRPTCPTSWLWHGSRMRVPGGTMRFINMYLIGYFILIVGICLALWQSGVLDSVAPIWIGIGAIVAVGVGIMMAVSSGKPTGTAGAR